MLRRDWENRQMTIAREIQERQDADNFLMPLTFTVIISDAQRRLILDAIAVAMSVVPGQNLRELGELIESLPNAEDRNPGGIHGICF